MTPSSGGKARTWTLCSGYSTDHDAMKWFVSRDSEITIEVEKPERVPVIERSAYTALEQELAEAKLALADRTEKYTIAMDKGVLELGDKLTIARDGLEFLEQLTAEASTQVRTITAARLNQIARDTLEKIK